MLKRPFHPTRPHGRLVRRLYPNGGGHQLEWMQVRTPRPRGTVFAPPLVGGDGLLVLRHIRSLRAKGYNLLSFNYAGHGLSSRRFSIRQSFRDTRCLLDVVRRDPIRFAEPHYGVGICYGAIPLLNALHRCGEPFPRIVLINAIPRLFSRNLLHSFWDFRRNLRSESWPAVNLAIPIRRYAEFLLPGITINRSHFGRLALRRMRILQTLVDWLASRQLRAVCLAKTSVLCVYSSDDRLFRAFRYFDAPRDYEAAVRRVCPTAAFIRLQGDHFLSNLQERQQAAKAVAAFFDPDDRPPCA